MNLPRINFQAPVSQSFQPAPTTPFSARYIWCAVWLVVSALAVSAQSSSLNYQGRLNSGGIPGSGRYDFVFEIFDAVHGGNSLGNFASNNVAVLDGTFAVSLDFPTESFAGPERWLQIQVRTNGAGAYITLSPRQRLTAVPTAIYAKRASSVTAGGITGDQIAAGAVGTNQLAINAVTAPKIANSQVVKSINALKDDVTLSAGANVTFTTNGNSLQISAPAGGLTLPYNGISGASTVFSMSNSGSGLAIAGHSGNGGIGLFGFSPSNKGVYGLGDYGVWGESTNVGGRGVVGQVNADFTGIGVIGQHTAYGNVGHLGTSRNGVYGISAGIGGGNGVAGYNTAIYNGAGVFGQHTLTGNYGQLGHPERGVDGVVTNTSSAGVRGTHLPTGNHGQLGTATHGVYGVGNSNSAGVYGGISPTGASGSLGVSLNEGAVGVYGQQGFGQKAGLFRGQVAITNATGGTALTIDTEGGDALRIRARGDNAAKITSDYCTALQVEGGGGCYALQVWPTRTEPPAGKGIEAFGDSDFYGDFAVHNGSKSAIVPTSQGNRKLYCEESSQVWFADYGSAQLINGAAVVHIDPLFAETVNLQRPYHVFVQLNDPDCNGLAVVNRQANTFEVRESRGGTSSAAFSYRLVALRRGFEDVRLEPAAKP